MGKKTELTDSKLAQYDGRNYRIFELLKDSMIVEYKQEGEYSKWEISYNDVGFEKMLTSKKPSGLAVGLLISATLNIFLVLFLLLENIDSFRNSPTMVSGVSAGMLAGLGAWIYQTFKNEKIKYISGVKHLAFFYRNKEMSLVDKFIERIKGRKEAYFRRNFMKIDELLPVDMQKQQFLWYYQNGQITNEEYEEILAELDALRIIKGE